MNIIIMRIPVCPYTRNYCYLRKIKINDIIINDNDITVINNFKRSILNIIILLHLLINYNIV